MSATTAPSVRATVAPTVAWRRVPAVAWTLALAVVLRVVYGAATPGYDAWWSLAWGRELAHGALPDLTAAWAPTPHPLAILLAAPLSLLGDAAPDVVGAASLVALAAVGVTAAVLGTRLFGPVAGAFAAVALITRPLLVGDALEATVDAPFLALVLGAGAAYVGGRPRRALALLVLAGLLRPEAWPLTVALAVVVRTPRALLAALAAPLLWALLDLLATGDPLHSLHGTRALADELRRPQSLRTALDVAPDYLTVVLGSGLALLGGACAIAAVWLAPRRAVLPLAVLGAGLACFLVLGVAGLPLLYRYTLLPAAALALLGAWGTSAALRDRRTVPLAVASVVVLLLSANAARAPIARHADHARLARADARDLTALVHAVAPTIDRCGVRVSHQRFAPQVAFVAGRAPRPDGAVTIAPEPGTPAAAALLAPSDGLVPTTGARRLDGRGVWTALSTC